MSDNLYRVPLVPVLSEHSQQLFNLDLPTEDVNVDGVTVKTGFLKPDARFNLMGLSQTQSLLSTGVYDSTDSIDPAMSVAEIAFSFKHQGVDQVYIHKLQTLSGTEAGSQLNSVNMRTLELNYAGVVPIFSQDTLVVNTVGVNGYGHVGLEIGDACIGFKVTNQEDPDFTDVKVIGYKLSANRVNYNRRAA